MGACCYSLTPSSCSAMEPADDGVVTTEGGMEKGQGQALFDCPSSARAHISPVRAGWSMPVERSELTFEKVCSFKSRSTCLPLQCGRRPGVVLAWGRGPPDEQVLPKLSQSMIFNTFIKKYQKLITVPYTVLQSSSEGECGDVTNMHVWTRGQLAKEITLLLPSPCLAVVRTMPFPIATWVTAQLRYLKLFKDIMNICSIVLLLFCHLPSLKKLSPLESLPCCLHYVFTKPVLRVAQHCKLHVTISHLGKNPHTLLFFM